MRWIRLIIAAIIAAWLFFIGNWATSVGPVSLPPVGKLLDPFSGFWQNNVNFDAISDTLHLDGLKAGVTVVWDDRRVPHIFAENEEDLYFAQGYVTAKERLWQMEFQTHFAAGRLSEIIGERGRSSDRQRRSIGMVYAAENALNETIKYPELRSVMEAYTAGVNAWITNLAGKDYPVEYKILNYKPEPWTMLKGMLLIKHMAWTLSARNTEQKMSATRKELGPDLFKAIFPHFPPLQQPVIPATHKWPFKAKAPVQPDTIKAPLLAHFEADQPYEFAGSNNWAVSAAKTASGYPILANDPHLNLSLPSVWFEIQLNAPNLNVYGVTLPGAPTVIIGFNESIAWGVTNGASDVLDYYRVEFRDSTKKEYLHNGTWLPTQPRVEQIQIRGGETLVDTVYYTHHGPVVQLFEDEKGHFAGSAMRWIAHDPSTELKAFLKLNRAEHYDDFVEALSYYDAPAQNFAFADMKGDIAIWHNGKFPLRWKGQGIFVSDGGDSLYNWNGFVPREHNPHTLNPERGFVSSANQQPASENYPYFLGSSYAGFSRSNRINEVLEKQTAIKPQDMLDFQLDNTNIYARTILPDMLEALEGKDLTIEQDRIFKIMKSWDYRYMAMQAAPTIWERWFFETYQAVWGHIFEGVERNPDKTSRPRTDFTISLLKNGGLAEIYARSGKKQAVSTDSLYYQAFISAFDNLSTENGDFDKNWTWGFAKPTNILHLARIPGFGREQLFANGGAGLVNATSKFGGPSWRMVVELGPEVRAWGIYPGGQSGNPGSLYYDNMVDDWVDGRAYELLFLKKPDDDNPRIAGKTLLTRN